ncbi:MAG: tetratricopeptide repeat protein [Deltaproteobacteria bacterium]|nr:tetratricopeptide repeat protein [Deltaproteobacteria bacterium]MBW2070917.1 tetratricopeptide repeat protein [Deltaproteobacteria bacterium]
MKAFAVILVTFFCLSGASVHAEDAMEYYSLGIKGANTRKKIAYFTKALQLEPKLAAAYEKRGLLQFYQGNYDKVIEDYQKYLALASPTAEAYRMLGMGYLKSGKYNEAIASFSRAIAIDPKLTSGYANRAEAYRLSGRDEQALEDCSRAIALRRDSRSRADAYRTRARIYRKLGRMNLAVEDVRAAMDVDPRVPRFWRYYLKYASPEELRSVAPFLLILLALVLIFGLRLKPPEKDD